MCTGWKTHVHFTVLPLPASLICILGKQKRDVKKFCLKIKGIDYSVESYNNDI